VTTEGVLLDHGPKENGHRPAVDALFRSAASSYGRRVIGVVLSGSRDDGAAGMAVIKAAGGMAMVQSPEEALYPSMPNAVAQEVAVDAVAGCRELARLVRDAVGTSVEGGTALPSHPEPPPPASGGGGATGLTCPECGGAIWEQDDVGVAKFVCHVGHRYSPDSMLEEHSATTEAALWTAVRLLNERAGLLRRLAERVRTRPDSLARQRFESTASEAERNAAIIRDAILTSAPEPELEEEAG
jgi:two-component system chemotaxis response regulator CheB